MARMNHQALQGRWADEIKRLAAEGDQEGVAELVDYIKAHVDQIGVFDGQWTRIMAGAAVRGIQFDLTKGQALGLYRLQDGRCALTGLPISFLPQGRRAVWKASSDASLDRIDAAQGYVIGNVWWLHRDVNRMKQDLPLDRFLELCRTISDREAMGEIRTPEGSRPKAPPPASTPPTPVLAVVWFLRDRAEDDPLHSETSGALWQSFQDWCRVTRSRPVTRTAFGRALRSLGYTNVHGHIVRWNGLRLVSCEGERV